MQYVIVFVICFILLFIFLKRNAKRNKNADGKSNVFEGKKLVLPKIEVSEEIDLYVKSLIDFVYEDGTSPNNKILSKKNQHNILCQIFSLDIDSTKYEPFVQDIYENAISKVNTYVNIIDREERYTNLHFAFEGTISNIIQLSSDKSKARDCFKAIDNLTDRLLQMEREKFKRLFFRLHEYHFWYVYNQDEEYKLTVEKLKRQLEFYHGIKQSDFYNKCSEAKDEISYVLYFAEKAGEIVRKEEDVHIGYIYQKTIPMKFHLLSTRKQRQRTEISIIKITGRTLRKNLKRMTEFYRLSFIQNSSGQVR